MAASWMRSRRLARAWRATRSASSLLLAVARVPAGVEELALRARAGRRRGRSATSRATSSRAPRYSAPGSRPSSTQLAAASRRWPSTMIASRSSSIQSPQAGPLAQQRLVGELDGRHPGLGMAIEGEQSRLRPPVDDGVDGRVGDAAGQLGARRRAVGSARPRRRRRRAARTSAAPRPARRRRGSGRAARPARRWPRRPRRAPGRRPASRRLSGLRSASSYSVNCSDGSAAGSSTTALTSSATRARSTRPPTRSAGSTMAASSSAGDIAGDRHRRLVDRRRRTRWTASGRS